jgi:two-component system, cell cycle sensor histidine kinase and response regulator CckA
MSIRDEGFVMAKVEDSATRLHLHASIQVSKCRWLWLLILLCHSAMAIGLWFGPAVAEHPMPQVLILNSYHNGFEWSDEELAGLLERLYRDYPKMVPFIEYLDEKRFPGRSHLVLMKDYLFGKYGDKKIDLLVVLDNPALDLALRYREEVFPGVPIVFAGINDFKPSMLTGHEKVTGVAENLDIAGTIELALALHPGTRELLVVHDYTATGLTVSSQLDKLLPALDGLVKVKFMPEITFGEIVQHVTSLPPEVLLTISNWYDSISRSGNSQKEARSSTCRNPSTSSISPWCWGLWRSWPR